MPYITMSERLDLSRGRQPVGPGHLNYLITLRMIEGGPNLKQNIRFECDRYLDKRKLTYHLINDIVGAIMCAHMEYMTRTGDESNAHLVAELIGVFYAHVAMPYELTKRRANGDVYPQSS